MELERTIGITALSNASIGINTAAKTVAFPCGSVVTEYNPKKNRQVDTRAPHNDSYEVVVPCLCFRAGP